MSARLDAPRISRGAVARARELDARRQYCAAQARRFTRLARELPEAAAGKARAEARQWRERAARLARLAAAVRSAGRVVVP